jgi:hypothetical protein
VEDAKHFNYSMENMQGNKKQDESIVPLSFPAESLLQFESQDNNIVIELVPRVKRKAFR